MEAEPRNAATDLTRRSVGWLNDRDFVVREGAMMVTQDFVRVDHRRVVAQRPVGAQAWVDGLFEWEKITGEWPVYELTKIIAVRGDRACACHWMVRVGDLAEVEFVVVNAADETGERFAAIHFFDPEDADLALAELDRLNAEIEAESL